VGRFQWLKEQLILQEHEIECLKVQQSLDSMNEMRILFHTGQGRKTIRLQNYIE
jgi:glycyl-tRNA synthetase (class II)